MKKFVSAALALGLVLSMTACTQTPAPAPSSAAASSGGTPSSEAPAAADDPILTGEKPELKILSMHQAYNYEEQPSHALAEELTGYKTKWYMLPADNSDQKLMLEISSGADYDILVRMSPNGYSQLSAQNALIDLTPLLEKYGQNILSSVSEFAWKSVTNGSGIVNGMPHENMLASKETPYGMLTGGIGVRSDMLEEMGLASLPTNLDDFTKFLEDAKAKYGVSPMTANSTSHFNGTILAAFGMGDAEWYDIDGVYTHRIKHPQMVDYLAYMQKLYKEKLIDNDMPINTADNAKEKFASKNAIAVPLAFWDIPSMVSALATSNPDCRAMFITDLASDANTKPNHYIMKGANLITCITQNSKNPEHAMNWMNILSTEENFRRMYIGEEGVSYKMVDGGYYPIFDGDETQNFSAYTNSDKQSGFCKPDEAFKMWQARARKTPEMAVAYEEMNTRCSDYNVEYSMELYGKTAPIVQQYNTALGTAFSDAFLKAVVEGTDPATALAAMQAEWDKNGGLEMEKAMQEFYDANKALIDTL